MLKPISPRMMRTITAVMIHITRISDFDRSGNAWLSQHVPGRAPLHRLEPGLGIAHPADVARSAHHDAAARDCRDGAAVAQSGAPGRAGRDFGPPVGGPAGF